MEYVFDSRGARRKREPTDVVCACGCAIWMGTAAPRVVRELVVYLVGHAPNEPAELAYEAADAAERVGSYHHARRTREIARRKAPVEPGAAEGAAAKLDIPTGAPGRGGARVIELGAAGRADRARRPRGPDGGSGGAGGASRR